MLKHKNIINILFLLAITLAGNIVLSSCSQEEGTTSDSATQKMKFSFSSDDSESGLAKAATRGTAETKTTLSSSIGMSCYTGTWNDDASLPDFFYNEEIVDPGTGTWMTSGSYFKPDTGTKRRYFAYYPYLNADVDELHNMTISESTQPGYPTIDYSVPDAVADQQDLMVGNTDESAFGETLDVVSLNLRHLLTAVRFAVGTSIPTCKVTKITIKNVFYSGSYIYPNETWSSINDENVKTFTQQLSKQINSTDAAGTYITNDKQSFMMMPQTVPNNATLEIIINDGQDHTLTTKLGGKVWGRAKVVTYNISITSLTKMTVTSDIVDWSTADSFTGEVSDASNVRNSGDINEWDPGKNMSNK